MTKLKVEDMHCEKCVARITKTLGEAGMKFSVSLPDKEVTIEEGDIEKAIAELDYIGFTARVVQ